MLHEVLLILSGQPSPLSNNSDVDEFPLVTAAERSLLKNAAYLGDLHRDLKGRLRAISKIHESLICRTVAASILNVHLSRFQKLILEKERQILSKDASTVGAYDIVPLAGLLRSFDGWKRILEWYWDLTDVMASPDGRMLAENTGLQNTPCNGALLMKCLKVSSNTGFPDIKSAGLELQQVAERVWMRYLSAWLLTGQLLEHGGHDFFVSKAESVTFEMSDFKSIPDLIPDFVNEEAASSILFIGKLLNFLKKQSKSTSGLSETKQMIEGRSAVTNKHLHIISAIEYPIRPAALAKAIHTIRMDFSNKFVAEMLPTHELLQTLRLMKDFFLMGNIEFADLLVEQSSKHLESRHQQLRTNPTQITTSTSNLAGLTMKQGELDTILSRTWVALAQSSANNNSHDDELDWAREHFKLKLISNITRPETQQLQAWNVLEKDSAFGDILLSTSAMLTMALESRLGFFLSPTVLHGYSHVHTYLLALRRGQVRIGDLWRRQQLRKNEARPHRSRVSQPRGTSGGVNRDTATSRLIHMRKVWACSRRAYFILAELGSYVCEEIIGKSWHHFEDWCTSAKQSSKGSLVPRSFVATQDENTISGLSLEDKPQHDAKHEIKSYDDQDTTANIHDIDSLSRAHQQYLMNLIKTTLLQDQMYVRALRQVLGLVDQILAFVERLQRAQRNLDLLVEGPDGALMETLTNEEVFLRVETTKAVERLDGSIDHLIARLRELSTSRDGSNSMGTSDEAEFRPLENGGSLDRLLMKLDLRLEDTT